MTQLILHPENDLPAPRQGVLVLAVLGSLVTHAGLLLLAIAVGILVAPGTIAPPSIPVHLVAAPAAPPPSESAEPAAEVGDATVPPRAVQPPGLGSGTTTALLVAADERLAEPIAGEGGAALAIKTPDETGAGLDPRRPPRHEGGPTRDTITALTGIDGGVGQAVGEELPLRVGGDVRAPEILDATKPEYPYLALMTRVEGLVVMSAIINSEGEVEDVSALSGPPLLIQAGLAALRKWRFRPGTLNGRPVRVSFTLNVRFTIRDPAASAPTVAAADHGA